MHWWLPLKGSTFAGDIDGLFLAILIITGIAFVVVEAGLIWFVIKYRQRPGRKAFYTHGNTRAEVIWTTIPAVTMVALGLISNHYWVRIKGRNSVPANAYPIAIHAKQFEWQVTYPGADGQLGTPDDFTVRNQLHVPVGRPVVFTMEGPDVIHSLWVPPLHGKKDLIPGHATSLWIKADRPGAFGGQCAEFCGYQHAHMRLLVIAESRGAFDAWLARQRRPAPEPTDAQARRGRDVFLTGPCAICHTIVGTPAAARLGPDLTHLAGRTTLAAGTLPNTPGHLAGWIIDPQRIKPGVHMPSIGLDGADLQALLAYLGSLK